jgi:hypothetical protein
MKTKDEIEILMADAKSGDATAQNSLGCAYSSGDGVDKDLSLAFSWFVRAADNGDMYGQYNAGIYYRYGYGTEIDIHKAIYYLSKSAKQKYEKAACELGNIYERGYTPSSPEMSMYKYCDSAVWANPEEAFYVYSQSSSETAKLRMAKCYELGIGTPKNLRRAWLLYKSCKDGANAMLGYAKDYTPITDTPLENLDVLKNNPFRILGVWSNSSDREIRANQSKMKVLSKIGRSASFGPDAVLPICISDYVELYRKRKEYLEREKPSFISMRMRVLKEKKEQTNLLNEAERASAMFPEWKQLPERSKESVSIALQRIASEKDKLKYAFFWFCCATDRDIDAIKLLSAREWKEAQAIWEAGKNYSALINLAVMHWIEGNYSSAIKLCLNVIHTTEYRQEFVCDICTEKSQFSEEELSQIFLDSLFDFPRSEISLYEICDAVPVCSINSLFDDPYRDAEYVKGKLCNILRSPIDKALSVAENDANDFNKNRRSFEEAIRVTDNQLMLIGHVIKEADYQYKMLCDDAAGKMLELAISCNNNNVDGSNEIKASDMALTLAAKANNIACDNALRERCHKNVEIFASNKVLGELDAIFVSGGLKNRTITQIEEIRKKVFVKLGKIKNERGVDNVWYEKITDVVVNRFLNEIIDICNGDRNHRTASDAQVLLKKLAQLPMTEETKNRFDKNVQILGLYIYFNPGYQGCTYTPSPEKHTAKVQEKKEVVNSYSDGEWAILSSILAIVGILVYLLWKNTWTYFIEVAPWWMYLCVSTIFILILFICLIPASAKDSGCTKSVTVSQDRETTRVDHKWAITILLLLLFGAICIYLAFPNTWDYFMRYAPWWMYTCCGTLTLIETFLAVMWSLEFKDDPYNYRVESLDGVTDWLIETSSKYIILTVIFFPLALAISMVKRAIRGLARLATLI